MTKNNELKKEIRNLIKNCQISRNFSAQENQIKLLQKTVKRKYLKKKSGGNKKYKLLEIWIHFFSKTLC